MEARLMRGALLTLALASLGASYRTTNFVVNAPTTEMAEQIGRAAEKYRADLAKDWLGHEMRNWAQPCPITAQVGDQLGAGGATSFVFEHGEVFGWRMTIQGSLVRILDSVLPHEITHTVFATHFRQPLPRWADEGACTTVEHVSERAKQQNMLIEFLHTNRGIAFNRMFGMKEYPHDVMPLYSQGYSVARYLVAQGGKHKFLEFLADGLRDENWARATQQHYGAQDLSALQRNWLAWVKQGSPALDVTKEREGLVAVSDASSRARRPRPEPNLILRDQQPDAAMQKPMPSEIASATVTRGSAETGSTAKDSFKPADAAADSEWQAHDDAVPAAFAAVDASARHGRSTTTEDSIGQYQATRPQPTERTKQIILEWSRPHKSAGEAVTADSRADASRVSIN